MRQRHDGKTQKHCRPTRVSVGHVDVDGGVQT
jgi:hypothetical protein